MSRRDPMIDLLRAGALLVVVVWHWVFTTIRWTETGPRVGNPVAVTPGLWLLTWVLQVMPAFFMIGGYLHSTNDQPAVRFWKRRFNRLVVPVLPLMIPATLLLIWLSRIGRVDLANGVVLIISPMWFLATYLVCVLFAPVAGRLDQRFGSWAVVPGLAIVALVDLARIGFGRGGVLTGALAFASVWLTVHQIGFGLGRVLRSSRRNQMRLFLGGYGMLGVAAVALPYPAAMVGLDGHELSNMGPPTVMVVLLAIGQLGLIGLCSDHLRRFARRRATMLTMMGDWSMTVYAWHLCAYAIFWAGLVHLGVPVSSHVDATWWILRPLWFVGPLAVSIPVCRLARRFDRNGAPVADRSAEFEGTEAHLFTDGLHRRVGQRATLPVRTVDDECVTGDEARVR